jgi:hypothetical protein
MLTKEDEDKELWTTTDPEEPPGEKIPEERDTQDEELWTIPDMVPEVSEGEPEEKSNFSGEGDDLTRLKKSDFSHLQPSIALFSFKHVSGCLEVALSLPGIRTIDYILLPDTKEVKRLLWKKELSSAQTEALYRTSERCAVYTEECCACGKERTMVDRGRPLCDACWEKECDQAAKQIVKHGKKP